MTLPTSTTLSLETAIRLIPHFNEENVQEVYPFINACNFVMQNVDETLQPLLLQVIITKLSSKTFAITQHKEISTWKRKGTGQKGRLSGSRVENSSPKLNILTCKIKLTNNYATYQIPQCVKGIANFLIDTGADLNIIKINALQDDVMVSDDKIYQMQGINDQLVNTLSKTLNVSINNAICKTEFQVVDSTFLISGDGILGNPFLKDNQIIIDVSKGELTTKSNDTTTIPARHEMIIPYNLMFKILLNNQILPYGQKEEIAKQVGEMQRDGIITPSDSPWNAPLMIVPKKSDDLGKAKYFTCLDMASGYHQIKLHPDDREKRGFSTDQGHFEFQRICFGLKGAPATFQRLMNQVFTGLNGINAFVYFLYVRSFLGLAGYYRRFIPYFSLITKPLTTLLKKNTEFIWTDLCQNAFIELKQLLSQQPILQYPDFSRPFIVTTDASNAAVGAILSQGKVESDLAIAYVSLRWRLQLEEHDYEITYKPRTSNSNADALSHIVQVSSSAQLTHHTSFAYEKYMDDIRSKIITNSNIVEVEGDLFQATADYALGHCVSKDFKMSEGIALEFRRKFGQVDPLLQQNKQVMEIAAIKCNVRNILYIITKDSHQQKPTYETIFYALKNLRD
ncbi:hypothetical protein QTP88_024412 [Uroleucon formosanum]